jgi:hypothetical protein
MANNKTQKKKQRRSRHNGGTKTPSKTSSKTSSKTAKDKTTKGKTASKITDPFVKELKDLKELADNERKYSTSRDISKLIKNPPLTTPEKNTALADFKKLLAVSVKANARLAIYKKEEEDSGNTNMDYDPDNYSYKYYIPRSDRPNGNYVSDAAEIVDQFGSRGFGSEFVAHTYKENECSICLSGENIPPNERAYCKKNGHTFHKECLESWKDMRGNMANCPICRGPI